MSYPNIYILKSLLNCFPIYSIITNSLKWSLAATKSGNSEWRYFNCATAAPPRWDKKESNSRFFLQVKMGGRGEGEMQLWKRETGIHPIVDFLMLSSDVIRKKLLDQWIILLFFFATAFRSFISFWGGIKWSRWSIGQSIHPILLCGTLPTDNGSSVKGYIHDAYRFCTFATKQNAQLVGTCWNNYLHPTNKAAVHNGSSVGDIHSAHGFWMSGTKLCAQSTLK